MSDWEAAVHRIADPVLRELAAAGRIRHYAKGSLILREHEPGDSMYVLLQGRVRVYAADAAGREVTLEHFEPVSYVGEMALDGRPRSASVCAQEPSVCAEVGWVQLEAVLRENPQVLMRMLLDLIGRQRRTLGALKDLALMDVYGRVARLLRELEYIEEGGERWSRERLTQQEIARRVGASRDMVGRILKELRAGGYIEQRAKRFRILRGPPARW